MIEANKYHKLKVVLYNTVEILYSNL